MTDQDYVNRLRIATPCAARWDEMTGDDRVRFCPMCHKHVYNISLMTSADAASMIRNTEGRICARLFRRVDGTALTADCPIGAERRRQVRRRQRVAAMIVGCFALFARGAIGTYMKNPGIATGPASDVRVTFHTWWGWGKELLGLRCGPVPVATPPLLGDVALGGCPVPTGP